MFDVALEVLSRQASGTGVAARIVVVDKPTEMTVTAGEPEVAPVMTHGMPELTPVEAANEAPCYVQLALW